MTRALALFLFASTAGPAAAQHPYRSDLQNAAAKIAEKVKEAAAGRPVRVGAFVPTGNGFRNGSAAPALELALCQALKGVLDPKAALEVRGRFAYAVTDGVKVRVIRIDALVVSGETEVAAIPPVPVLYVPDVARFVGVNGHIEEGGTAPEACRAMEALVLQPTAVAVGPTALAPAANSPYRVEVRGRGKTAAVTPRPVAVEGGLPFVTLADEPFEVVVTNAREHEVAVRVWVDGLDQFAFTQDRTKDGRPGYTHVLIPAATGGKPGEAVVRGWHKQFDPARKTHAFADFAPRSLLFAVPERPRPAVGTIGLSFERAEVSRPRLGGHEITDCLVPNGAAVRRHIFTTDAFLTVRFNRPSK